MISRAIWTCHVDVFTKLTSWCCTCVSRLASSFRWRWAPTSYKWGDNPDKWPYKRAIGVIAPISGVGTLLVTTPAKYIYEQRTKPITPAKRRGWNGHRFLCVPHRSWGFNVCNKIRRTCVSRVIVFCVTPIVPESFMMVSSINVLV